MTCPVMWVWNKLQCKIKGHPLGLEHEVVPISFTSFFSGGVVDLAIIRCSKCKSILGKVNNDSV